MISSLIRRVAPIRRLQECLPGAVFVLAAALSAAAPAAAQQADDYQGALDRYLRKEELPGGVLLVSAPHQRVAAASGTANRRTGAPVEPGSRFYVASVGKMAVAAATLQLVEEGKLALDATVAPLVGGADVGKLPNARAAKLEQLLNHSSGIPDYLTDDFTAFYHAASTRLTPAKVLPYAFGEEASHRPGKAYEYSNTNYVLLGDIIAAADGEAFEAVLQRRVLDRAGMRDTTVGARDKDARLARGYADPEETGETRDVSRAAWLSVLGDGPLVTTADDLERFAFALFRDGKLLQPATLARMIEASPRESGYGMGVEIGNDRWGDWVGHSGLEDGFEAEVRYYPKRKAVLVFMTNGNSQSETSILDKAAALLFRGGN